MEAIDETATLLQHHGTAKKPGVCMTPGQSFGGSDGDPFSTINTLWGNLSASPCPAWTHPAIISHTNQVNLHQLFPVIGTAHAS